MPARPPTKTSRVADSRRSAGKRDTPGFSETACDDAFDYTGAVWKTANHICRHVRAVGHIDMRRLAVDFTRCRNQEEHGTLATVTPLRDQPGIVADGTDSHSANRQLRYVDVKGRRVIYLLTIFLPRFANLPFHEKLVTIAHELWHISEACDGRLRTFPGRCRLHGHDAGAFDRQAEEITQTWLKTAPPAKFTDYLQSDFEELARRHGRIIGQEFSQSQRKA